MRISKRDALATVLVAAALVVYVSWLAGAALPFLGSARGTGALVLVFGFLASASAVVPTFGDILHGDRTYLVLSSALGLLALGAGVYLLVNDSRAGLAVLMSTMVVLWLSTTVHHSALATQAGTAATGHAGRHLTLHR